MRNGRALTDAAMSLSPLDPLRYGMLGVRAFSHIVLDEPAEAAIWRERAARAPHAHPLIELVAAVGHGLNGDNELDQAERDDVVLSGQPTMSASLAPFSLRSSSRKGPIATSHGGTRHERLAVARGPSAKRCGRPAVPRGSAHARPSGTIMTRRAPELWGGIGERRRAGQQVDAGCRDRLRGFIRKAKAPTTPSPAMARPLRAVTQS